MYYLIAVNRLPPHLRKGRPGGGPPNMADDDIARHLRVRLFMCHPFILVKDGRNTCFQSTGPLLMTLVQTT